MEQKYHLRIGSTDVFSVQLILDLSSDDAESKKKAEAVLIERLKEARVRVGTILKTDNVSFLIGAGASMNAGGVGLASIPLTVLDACAVSKTYAFEGGSALRIRA